MMADWFIAESKWSEHWDHAGHTRDEAIAMGRENFSDREKFAIGRAREVSDEDFWKHFATLLFHYGLEHVDESMAEDGYIDWEDGWTLGQKEQDAIVNVFARLIPQQVKRPAWMCVDQDVEELPVAVAEEKG